MKAAKDQKTSYHLNNRTPSSNEPTSSRPAPRRTSTRTRSQTSPGSCADTAETSLRNRHQAISGNSAEKSKYQLEYPGSAARTTSNENNTKIKESHRRTDAENEHLMIPPNRTPPLTGQFTDASEISRDDDRAECLSVSVSTTSSFLKAAAIPPRLTTQETTPGAVCVPGLAGPFDDNQHDNLLDMEDESDGDNTNNNNSNNISIGIISRSSTLQSPQSTSMASYSQSTSTSIPIVAELAPTYFYCEQEVENRVAERLEAQLDAQITERLQQEVDRRFSQAQRQHAIAEVIGSSNDTDYFNSKSEKEEDDNFEICGIRRTRWGFILCVIMLLTIACVGGTYLWFSRVRGKENDNIDGTNGVEKNQVLPQSSLAPTTTIITDNTLFPQSTAPTILTMPSSPSTTYISASPNSTEFPPSLVNLTEIPTPTPSISNEPFTFSYAPSSTDQRWEHLIINVAPYVVPDKFVDLPATYFVNETYTYQYAALNWMAVVDLETDIFSMSIQFLVERYVLALLYYSTGGDQAWAESLSFLSSSNVCDWNNHVSIPQVPVINDVTVEGNSNVTEESANHTLVKKGVFCRNGSLFVTSIHIPSNSLKGKIPWELSLLKYLTQVDFDTNELYGSIPIELSRLSRLQALWFKNNALTGRLPVEFSNATALASIDLGGNNLTSILPPEWGSLSNLFYVSLRLNNLTGILPSDWRTLNRLKTLDLEGNQLHGTLPEEYGDLTNLVSLYFESNRFEGLLPPTFGNLTKLVNLFLDDNLFSGTVPTEYSALTNLEYFWFHGNLLSGSVDRTFCDSYPLLNGANLSSNCLGNDLFGVPAQIECSCCTSCCNSNGTNCIEDSSP